MKILGIDPGLVNTGVAIINAEKDINCIFTKTIKTSNKDQISKRLTFIHEELEEILKSFEIDIAGIEKTFINSNAKTSTNLSIARGIALLNLGRFGLDFYEIDPNFIKKQISGYGHSSKEIMKDSLKFYIKNQKFDHCSEHEIDAISISLCAYFMKNNKIYQKMN